MPLPEVASLVRSQLVAGDIDEVNRVFSDAFTDRYHRDGMTGVRVPELNPAVWRFAIAAAGPGAMVWRDDAGVAAFNLGHANGVEGWMGPLAVRTDWQGRGLGQTIVAAGVEYLEHAGCRRIGLETMPRAIENIGFYSRLGFTPGHLTVSMVRDLHGVPPRAGQRFAGREAGMATDRFHALVNEVEPGLDVRRETELTLASTLGDLTAVGGDRWTAAALWHAVPLSSSRSTTELRVLKLAARDRGAFRLLAETLLAEGARRGVERVAIRCQSAYAGAYRDLIGLGFRVQWTDLRMERASPPPVSDDGPVTFSNWEI
ncbi:MAG: GNAT family N-acetyltransferase [Gemmatimonadetes bacterium]|nr:GNAT family N-acetyltransferase [Gemmatimonadota bacterium]